MITSIDKITVNTPEEYLNAFKQGYYIENIKYDFDEKELFNYFFENKSDSPENMVIYALHLFNGRGTEVDYENAMVYAKKSADYGNAIANNLVGYMYNTGKGVQRDISIGFEYYKRAAKLGCAEAYRKIGIYYEKGYIVAKSTDKAMEYYKRAEELGCLVAICDIGKLYFNLGEYEKSLAYHERAAELEIEKSYFQLAYLLSNENFLEPDYEKAVCYYQILVEKKNPAAMNNLAILYERGRGVEKNLQKAFELYKEATENGGKNIEFSNLANCYFWGRGVEQNYKNAFEASLKSCEFGGDGKAFQMLYRCYNEGLGTERDIEKAKHYRDLALSSDDITVVIDATLEYIREARTQLDKFKLTDKAEIIKKLNEIIEKKSENIGFYESYLFAEIYYFLFKIEPEKWKEHNGTALLYAKKTYDDGKELANHRTMQRMYGKDFFDFNVDNDYVAYDVSRFDGYTIGTTRVTYVPEIEAKANNYSIEYWLPRARLVYAMWCELENKHSLTTLYSNALSTETLDNQITYKSVVYPNALFMNATRYIMGYDAEIDEDYGVYLLRLAGERYHTRSAYLYGNYCKMHENYEEAFQFYRIAIANKYIDRLKRVEIPLMLVKPGEKSYSYNFEYGGEKVVSYEAVEDIVENYDKFNAYIKADEAKEIADLFFEIPYKLNNPERFFKAFYGYYIGYLHFDKFVEKYAEEFISLETAVALINKNKADIAINIFKKAIKNGDLEAVKNAKRAALDYRVYEGELEEAIQNRLLDLGEAEEKKEAIEPVKVTEKESGGDEELRNHPIWSYLKFNIQNSIITELASLLYFPNKLSEKEICKKISKYFIPMTPIKITAKEVNEVLDYAKTSNMYFQCGILLLSFNCTEGLNLLTKHYMNNIDCLLKLSDVAIMLYEKQPIVYSFPYSFNKAMCLLSKGDKKGNKILKAIVSLKGASKLEKCTVKPYQPAVDFLNGIEVNEEYLLNIRRING